MRSATVTLVVMAAATTAAAIKIGAAATIKPAAVMMTPAIESTTMTVVRTAGIHTATVMG